MPPRPKYNRDEIVDAAFALAREQGMSAVVAREVGSRLGTSSSPIFTVFDNMEQLQTEVERRGWALFADYLKVAEEYYPAFKMRGFQMVRFAQEEPKLFQMLFMKERPGERFQQMMERHIEGFGDDIALIQQDYHLEQAQARALFDSVWVHAYGICTLCAMNDCAFTEAEIHAMLGEAFVGRMLLMKTGSQEYRSIPAKRDTKEGKRLSQVIPDVRAVLEQERAT